MSMQDTISDFIVRIMNAQAVNKKAVVIPQSKLKLSIAKVLKDEGYIVDFIKQDEKKPEMTIQLKYFEGKPVICEFKRASKPSLRIYKGKNDLPKIKGGIGVAVVSTDKGVMSDREARRLGIGGEVLCYLS